MKFEHTHSKDTRRRNAQIDRLAHAYDEIKALNRRRNAVRGIGIGLTIAALGLLLGACLYAQV